MNAPVQGETFLDDEPASAITPEARRRAALQWLGDRKALLAMPDREGRHFVVASRVIAGVWEDGFIHAGNFAYMSIVALFPFFIALSAILAALGEQSHLEGSIDALLAALPRRVYDALAPVARGAATERHGWLLWIGGLLGLWTTTSLIETIRDILHRAYGSGKTGAFWRYRLISSGLIFGSVLLLLLSLSSQVLISLVQEAIGALLPGLDGFDSQIAVSRIVSAIMLFASIYGLFFLLTPARYQARRYPKWPGAAFVTAWWLAAAWLLPRVLHNFIAYDLTYGSLAGVVIALFFFWLVGLGMVSGAELNAALAVSPEEQAMLGGVQSRSAGQDNEVQDDDE